jgi:hypothetical protein
MHDHEFEALSLRIGMVIDNIAFKITELGAVHATYSSLGPGQGCLLTIRKSSLVTEMRYSGSFALKNDPDDGFVQIAVADARIPPGLPRVERVAVSDISADTIRTRIDEFVSEWHAA